MLLTKDVLLQKVRRTFVPQNASHLLAFSVTRMTISALHRIRRSELSFHDYRPRLTVLDYVALLNSHRRLSCDHRQRCQSVSSSPSVPFGLSRTHATVSDWANTRANSA